MLQPTYQLVAHVDCLAISLVQHVIFLIRRKYLVVMDELDYSIWDYLVIEFECGIGEAKSSDIGGGSRESTKSRYSKASVGTSTNEESVSTSLIGGPNKLHKANDARLDVIDAHMHA